MLRLAVRDLAELVHRRGDLHVRLDGRTRAEEGIAAQRRVQRDRAPGYLRERAASLTTTLAGEEVCVSGRIDGCDLDGGCILVEEVKTTRADPELAHRHHAHVHWAQARLYAALLARELDDGRPFELRLVYCHPATFETRTFTLHEAADGVVSFLDATLQEHELWLSRQKAHEASRNARLRALDFPFPAFRPFQRAMARRAYRALRDREHLLLEAPTGSGKTAATLYPAVRALERSGYRRILFLTSRSTGALAVRDAAVRLDPHGQFLRHVTITAREKACFLPGTPCEPDACPYARGYYDRSRDAVAELLERRAADPEAIAEVARRHEVCPFELSLDTASWCDLAVGDYNYLFDPVVRLQRFANDPDTALLVDESHQLAPRVRDMLSLDLCRREVKDALAESPPDVLARRLKSVERALSNLKRNEQLGPEKTIARPEPLLRSLQRLTEAAADVEEPLDTFPATRDVLFNAFRWQKSDTWFDADRFRFLGSAEGRQVAVSLVCLDPGPYIRERFDEYGGHIRFSGTVSPLPLYAHLHGEAEGPAERAGNPFSPEQLRVLVVNDVPTYLRHRPRSAPALVQLIRTVVAARPGHYLVAFPSFDYLDLIWHHHTPLCGSHLPAAPQPPPLWERPPGRDPATSVWERPPGRDPASSVWERPPGRDPATSPTHPTPPAAIRQTPGMTDQQRADFLAAFRPDAPPCVGFVVLGGVFGESVDFSAARLSGVICVGVGLPPPSVTRCELQRHFDQHGLDGAAVAYHQPAMVKVLQMAGRLLRSPSDRGVLCLVDGRFLQDEYRRFFPDHWQPHPVRAQQVADDLADFWSP